MVQRIQRILISWVGNTDLKASENISPQTAVKTDEIGPIARILLHEDEYGFDRVILISDHKSDTIDRYQNWLSELKLQKKPQCLVHSVKLHSPTDLDAVMTHVLNVLDIYLPNEDSQDIDLFFNISSGTPAMYATWLFLAQKAYPAVLLESYFKNGQSYVIKKFVSPELLTRPSRIPALAELSQEIPPEHRKRIEKAFASIIGESPAMKACLRKAKFIAYLLSLEKQPKNVLLLGESGTGKDLLAKAIHESSRPGKPFISQNCSAIPSELFESELFGHVKGSFTGAIQDKEGLLERARGGTIFLNEIGDIDPRHQAKLLQVLEEDNLIFQKVGSTVELKVECHIIAATDKNLSDMLINDTFRFPLYNRLNGFTIHLPPLRERGNDVVLIAQYWLEKYNRHYSDMMEHYQAKTFSQDALQLLLNSPWKGNVRELRDLIKGLCTFYPSVSLLTQELITHTFGNNASRTEDLLNVPIDENFDLNRLTDEFKRHYIRRVRASGKTQMETAEILKISKDVVNRLEKK